MSDIKEIRVFKPVSKKNTEIKSKNTDEKKIDSNNNDDNLDFSIGLTMRSTKIFPDNNKTTRKSNSLKISTKKKSITSLKNKLIYIGDIEQAKTHSKANRPLKKVGEFDSKTQFCKCCGLPCEKEGVMEKYSFKDSTEEFIKHGQVISLYFSFYIYSIFILLYAFLSISLPTLIINYQRANELNKICNEISNNYIIDECFIYKDDNIIGSSYNSILDFSGLNIKNYKIIHSKLSSTKDDIDKMIVNYSVLNFIGLIAILIFNFGYIILLNNKAYLPDIDLISPKKYSIIITEMDGFYSYLKEKFLSDTSTNNEEDKNSGKDKKSKLVQVIKVSDRDKLQNQQEIDEYSGVEKFKNLFKEKISDIFLDKKEKQEFNIKQVNVCFKINEYLKKEGKLEKCNEYIEKIESLPYQIQKNEELGKKDKNRSYFYSPLSDFNIHWFEREKKLEDILEEKKNLEKEINILLEDSKKINMDKFAGAVIISFNTIKEKEEFLSNFPNNFFVHLLNVVGKLRYFFCFCCIKKIDNSTFWKKKKIQIDEAPEPEDIVFENLEFTTMKKTYRVVGMNMISLLLIGIGFVIIFGLQNLQNHVKKKNYIKFVYYLISLCITIVSSIINIIFGNLLDFLTKTEKLKSITTYYLSYSVKLALFSFLISGIIPLICEVISKTENYEILISNMIVMFLVNSIVTPLMWTFSPEFYIKKLQVYLIERNKKPNLYHNRNQKELNKLYELSDMNIANKYSYIAKTLLMTFLYISFLEKYNYINYYKRPEMLNNDLFYFYVNNFVFFLFFLAVGDYIFLSDIFKNNGWPLANIIILAILIIIPYQFLLNYDFIGFKESDINKLTYDDVYLDFYLDYERANPMTKKEGMKKYIEKLSENRIINKEQKNNYLKNIENINLMKAYYDNRKNFNLVKIQKMLAHIDTKNMMKIQTFKASLNNNFKLSGNYKNNNNNFNFKYTINLRGENKKGRNMQLFNSMDKKEEEIKNNDIKLNINEDKIIKELNESEKLEKNKSIEKANEKDSIQIEENNDPILLRMASSLRVAELLEKKENEYSEDNSFGIIDEIEEIENAEEKYVMGKFEESEENDDEDKDKEKSIKESEENDDEKEKTIKNEENESNDANENEEKSGN